MTPKIPLLSLAVLICLLLQGVLITRGVPPEAKTSWDYSLILTLLLVAIGMAGVAVFADCFGWRIVRKIARLDLSDFGPVGEVSLVVPRIGIATHGFCDVCFRRDPVQARTVVVHVCQDKLGQRWRLCSRCLVEYADWQVGFPPSGGSSVRPAPPKNLTKE